MLGEPLLHLRGRPFPLERMGLEAIVFGPSNPYVVPELLPASPRGTVQIMTAERLQQHFGSVAPRGMGRRLPGAPPGPGLVHVVLGRCGRVAGVAVVDQG